MRYSLDKALLAPMSLRHVCFGGAAKRACKCGHHSDSLDDPRSGAPGMYPNVFYPTPISKHQQAKIKPAELSHKSLSF